MNKIDNQILIQKLTEKFAEQINSITEPYGLLTFHTSKEAVLAVLSFLKEDEALQFNFLTDITAVHYPELKQEEIAVVYHLHSFTNNIRVRLKVFLSQEQPVIPSATSLWNGANWMERETFDFFGVQFSGHPDLRRILNVDEMTVYPMLKQYPLEDPNRVDKNDDFFGR